MDDREDKNRIIDVDPIQINEGDQVAWKSCFDEEEERPVKLNKRRKRGFLKYCGLIAGSLALAITGGLIGSGLTYKMMKSDENNNTSKATEYVAQSFKTDSTNSMSAAEAFNKVSPAVVIVSTKGLQEFDNGFFSQQQEVEGIGSGFIINEEGYILTNYHVVEDVIQREGELKVTLSTNEEVPAKVVNYDSNRDIAMLKLTKDVKVPGVAELGDSDSVYPGEEVIAIGTPLSKNFAQTLTKGVISGSNRSIATGTDTQQNKNSESVNLIQTDAAINPGNSGGPLVNTKGQVIGINSMKIGSQTGSTTVEGIGFAIPINEVKAKIDDLSKPILNLGIKIREINKDMAKQYGLEEGVYVVSVDEFSPAEKGGIKIGDVIVKCDGKDATTLDKLKAIKQSKNAGDSMSVEVIRNGKKVDLTVTLEDTANTSK